MINKEKIDAINTRKRFQRIMNYEPVDKLLVMAFETHMEAPTLLKWRKEGLPDDQLPDEYLGMDKFMVAPVINLAPKMFSYWSKFVLGVIRPAIGKIKIDFAVFMEDLAYKNAPHVSPQIYKEFWLPHQKPIINELQENGVKIIGLWSAGKLDVLTPLLLENGINFILPCDCDDPV